MAVTQRMPPSRTPKRISNVQMGAILVALVVLASYFAVTKELPFGNKYEVKAVFANAANVRVKSPVRIAGVNVGEVESVRSLGDNAEVTFSVGDEARPLKTDSTVQIRPRIFLEGNFFLDVKPGTPEAPEISDGGTIPVTQTSTAVQLDELLTSLRAPSRENLQLFLQGYGTGLNHVPTAAEDADQDPAVKGKTGAQAINGSFRYGGDAGRGTAIVNEALLGTEPHDLSGLIDSGNKTFRALVSRETQLQDLIVNFNTTAGAFASESENLNRSIQELGPTVRDARPSLVKLNDTFPQLRAFARDIRPGIAEIPATIVAAEPWLAQAKPLLSKAELGGLAKDLRGAAKPLAQFTHSSLSLFPQIQLASSCFSNVILPAGDVPLTDANGASTGQPNYREFFYSTVGIAGESQGFDANGPFLRFQSGGGSELVSSANPNGGFNNDRYYGYTIPSPVRGTQPLFGPHPAYRTDVACANNEIPNLNGPLAGPGTASPAP